MKIIDKYKYIRSNFSCYGFFESINISLKPFHDEYDLQSYLLERIYDNLKGWCVMNQIVRWAIELTSIAVVLVSVIMYDYYK